MPYRITTPELLVGYAMSAVDYDVRHVESVHVDISATGGNAVRVIVDGPIHPLVDGKPTLTRFTVHEAKLYLGVSDLL